ncbi:MAG: hypothetical protein O2985_14225, partial [Proteobacteria bacterium]|nr:hypothetical protein [Pseudomonadota bacterium]
WTAADLPLLGDPSFIDRMGHFVHAHQDQGYRFDMPVMGYQALFYAPDFEAKVKSETGIAVLKTLVHEIRRGAFAKTDEDGWEISFRAEAAIRNELDPTSHLPIGAVDYATDLSYSNTVLFSVHETALAAFGDWARSNGLA